MEDGDVALNNGTVARVNVYAATEDGVAAIGNVYAAMEDGNAAIGNIHVATKGVHVTTKDVLEAI